jgi:rare lipoprotein A
MKLWLAFGSTIALFALCDGPMADPAPVRPSTEAAEAPAGQAGKYEMADTLVRIAAVAGEIGKVAGNAIIARPVTLSAGETTSPLPAEAAAAAAPVSIGRPQAAPAGPSKSKAARKSDKRPAGAAHHDRLAASPAVRVVGKSETGTAAWYGGRYVGRRTTSGARLDTVHATAAHRTLPLNSLARVTNLRNGRSVIVRVTDRGPVNDSLLIDMSPVAADMLQMKAAGLAPVRVEQVVELPPDAK